MSLRGAGTPPSASSYQLVARRTLSALPAATRRARWATFVRESAAFRLTYKNSNGSWCDRKQITRQLMKAPESGPVAVKNHFQRVRKARVHKPAFKVERRHAKRFMLTSCGTRKYLNLLAGEAGGRNYWVDGSGFPDYGHFSAAGIKQFKRWLLVCRRLKVPLPLGYDENAYAFDLCEMTKILTWAITGHSLYLL